MENVMTINAESRKESGKKIARKLRKEGRIPAIIYGEKKESIPISFSAHDIKRILKSEKGENTVLRIKRDNIQVDAMLKEVQYDYLSNNIIHLDLIRIDLNKSVNVNVPIVIVGESIGVKMEDGILDFITRELKIKCQATKIPKEFTVDITELHSGQSIKVEALDLGEEIKLLSSPDTVICSVSTKGPEKAEVEEVEEEVEEEAAEAKAEEPAAETEEEKKPEEPEKKE
jgi:large subunit ribosomal protein L25